MRWVLAEYEIDMGSNLLVIGSGWSGNTRTYSDQTVLICYKSSIVRKGSPATRGSIG